MPLPLRTRSLVAAISVAFVSVLLASAESAAQVVPPCVGCNPGAPPETPPEVAISPSTASYVGEAAGHPQPVEIVWCSGWPMQAAGRRIVFNGRDVTSEFTFEYGGSDGSPGCAQRYVSSGGVTLGPGANTLTAEISNLYGRGTGSAVFSHRVTSYGVSVGPDAEEVGVYPTGTGMQQFTVTNAGNATATFNLTAFCGPAVASCSPGSSAVTLAAGATATVPVTWTAGAGTGSGTMRLRAARAGAPDTYDEGSLQVNVASTSGAQATPVLVLGDGMHGATPTPGLCLTMPAGPAAAYQCGDLRVAHALPAVRTLNRARAPTLVYNSAHAAPMALAGAEVQLPAGASPTRVSAVLTVAGATDSLDYTGAEWTPGWYRRITRGALADGLLTGLYDYTLRVTFWYGATAKTATLASTAGVVNRSLSPFGAGWWLAGLERIQPGTGTIVWTGGDGAQRRYQQVADSVWVAPTVTHRDTLRLRASGHYARLLPGGDTVVFDPLGRHVATVDLQRRRTLFFYADTTIRIDSIAVPTGASVSRTTHRFTYDPQGRLREVQAPDTLGGWTRKTVLAYAHGDRRVTSITDPDQHAVHFGYAPGAPPRIVSRTDRRGNPTSWAYDAAGKLAEASTSLGAGEVPSRVRWQPAESRGWTRSVTHDSHATVVDGPRVDVQDVSRFFVNAFGAPWEIRDAEGRVTRIAYDAAFPALPRRVRTPSGQVSGATYDARGNVLTVTDSSTSRVVGGVREYATTRYVYDAVFRDFPTRIVNPEKDSTLIWYRADGLRGWMQDARGDSTRVYFTYDAATMQVQTVRSQKGHATPDSLRYDALGNLRKTTDALGDSTLYRNDVLGRTVRTVTPIRLNTASGLPDSAYVVNRYDVMDRVWLTESVGPPMALPAPAAGQPRLVAGFLSTPRERLFVRTFHDAEGRPDSVVRWSDPDSTHIGRMATRWVYDAAGRAVREVAADGATEHRALDEAGNLIGAVTRRGHVVSSSYDVMNRLVRRITPPVTYSRFTQVVADSTWTFPRYEQVEPGAFGWAPNTQGLVIPGDTAVFAYDTAGRMVAANNRDAKVTRVWNPNGTLASETQRIRTYLGADFDAHAYTVGYEYDLNGRRTKVHHPASLAPAGSLGYGRYEYHPHGALSAVHDVIGNGTSYHWDAEGQLARRVGKTQLTLGYDAEGRVVRRSEHGGVLMHDDTLTYDERGKVLTVAAYVERITAVNRYSGLGGLVYGATRDSVRMTLTQEEYLLDPFANYRARVQSAMKLGTLATESYDGENYGYEAGTGRQVARQGGVADALRTLFDASGNQVATQSHGKIRTPYDGDNGNVYIYSHTRSYYGADEMLRVLDRKSCLFIPNCDYGARVPPASERPVFEEYRYDALGRRVLTRTRHPMLCNSLDCAAAVVRTVWDGDQLLYEVRAPAGAATPAAEMERDTGHAPAVAANGYYGFGRVAYAHGLGIDDPVTVVRVEYSGMLGHAISIQPVSNWAQRYDGGAGLECVYYGDGNTQIVPVVNEPGSEWEVDGPRPPNTGGQLQHCVSVDWPAQGAWLNLHEKPDDFHPRKSWMGSLIQHGRDASGQYYRRNRYYDPSAGRFTQEDPIGLPGGINLYGYANGDPIRYSDPYGLYADSVIFGSPKLEAVVRKSAARSPTLGETLEDMELNPDVMVFIGEMDLNNPGLVKPGKRGNHPAENVIQIWFDFAEIGPLNGFTHVMNGGGVTADDVIGHEIYGHAQPLHQGTICLDGNGCARQRENVIRLEMGRPPRTF